MTSVKPDLLQHYKVKTASSSPTQYVESSVRHQLPVDALSQGAFTVQLKGVRTKDRYSTVFVTSSQAAGEIFLTIFPNLPGFTLRLVDCEGYVVRQRTIKAQNSTHPEGSCSWWSDQTNETWNILRKGVLYNAAPLLKASTKKPRVELFLEGQLNRNKGSLAKNITHLIT